MRGYRKQKKHRIALLTVIFALIVFCIIAATMAIVWGIGFVLVQTGLWTLSGRGSGSLPFVLLIFALASIGVGTILAVTLGRLPFRPLGRLLYGLQQLTEGDYSARLPEEKKFGRELSRRFNLLAEELQNTEMLRSDFVNSFSHEFKTPIVSIQGFAQLLSRGGLSEKQTREYLEIIEEESRRLAAMATNVLNYSKIENQKILTGISRFNLSEQIRTCILLLEKKWSRKELELSLEFQEYEVTANEEMLKQVWINLLDNAVKFTPEKGKIEVSIQKDDRGLLVRVGNSGPEISPEEQKRIFQKFYQSDSSHAKEGTGLGLTIARRIAELHGGTIAVESGEGRTVFTVRLPQPVSTL